MVSFNDCTVNIRYTLRFQVFPQIYNVIVLNRIPFASSLNTGLGIDKIRRLKPWYKFIILESYLAGEAVANSVHTYRKFATTYFRQSRR